MRTLKLATRASRLALAQAGLVQSALEALGQTVELVEVTTRGDRDRKSPLVSIGGQGLFVREVERCLLDGTADLAVHSGKDLPYELAEGLLIAGVPKAASPCDVLAARKDIPLRTVGTGSPRRVLECRQLLPDAAFREIRGNVDTRLRKLRDGDYDAVVLAEAGLQRLGVDLSDLDVRVLSPDECLPAPCQGILAVECREDDGELIALLEQITDPMTRARFDAERKLFCLLQADCSVPLGVHCAVSDNTYTLSALFGDRKAVRTGTDIDTLCEEIRQELTS